MNIIISGGGTGGHIFPALAIADAMTRRDANVRVHFVGTRYGMETDLVPKAGYPLYYLPIRGFLGRGVRNQLALLWRLPLSLLLSVWLLLRLRPKLVLGVGGYASGPLLFVAALFRIPTLIQEQNAFPGVTNRMTSRVAKLALCGFAEAGKYLRCPVIATGNPVRGSFRETLPWTAERKLVLVLGGSQGAKALNQRLPAILLEVLRDRGLELVHQCGRNYREQVEAAYAGASMPVTVTPFIERMDEVMNRALLIICRAGASTIAELEQTRVPAILVPFPNAAHDHQTFNARSLEARGLARLVPEAELDRLTELLRELLTDRDLLVKMATAAPPAKDDAAARCAEIAAALISGKEVSELVHQFGKHV